MGLTLGPGIPGGPDGPARPLIPKLGKPGAPCTPLIPENRKECLVTDGDIQYSNNLNFNLTFDPWKAWRALN